MGKSQFYVVVMHGYAVHYELDGSMALFETSSLPDGVYDQDYEIAPSEIGEFYKHLISEKIPHLNTNTESLTKNALRIINETDSLPIYGVPKMTKALAEGVTKATEVMTFYIDENTGITFLCFGIRLPMLDFLESQQVDSFSCVPLNYYYATNFKGEIYGLSALNAGLLMLYNEEKTCGGLIFSIEMIKFDEYRKRLQMPS